MGTKTVHLHGGPYHGRSLQIPEDHNHFHILGVDPAQHLPNDVEAAVETREGTYSQVSGANNQNEFEWDGWVSH